MKWVRVINGLMLLLALGLVMQLQQYRATAGANQFPFQMVMFDVGEGDAVLIKSEAGSALIDAGPDVGIVSDLSQALPDKKLDYLVITHPHADHIGQAVSVLRHFQVGKIIYTGVQYESQVYQDFISETQQKNIPLEAVDQNSDWQIGDVTFDVLS